MHQILSSTCKLWMKRAKSRNILILWMEGVDENRLTRTALSEVSAMSFAWRGCQHLNQWLCRQLLSPTPCWWGDAPFFLKKWRKIFSRQLLSSSPFWWRDTTFFWQNWREIICSQLLSPTPCWWWDAHFSQLQNISRERTARQLFSVNTHPT